MSLPKPITRTDYYLSKISGEYQGSTPKPIQRKDFYLAKIAGDYTGMLPEPITREDIYLAKIAGDYSYPLPKPITRIDYLLSAIAGAYDGNLPSPITREEIYLTATVNQSQYVTKTAQGASILITDSAQAPLEGLRLFGKSTQDGTPSPENPVPIVSAGDSGQITVSITGDGAETQSIIYHTPNGLPGILVSSGSNYTDESGQQWVCDEVDFGRGVYVRRVLRYTWTPDDYRYSDNQLYNLYTYRTNVPYNGTIRGYVLSDIGHYDTEYKDNFAIRSVICGIRMRVDGATSVEDLREMIPDGFTTIAEIEPQETPLTPDIIAAYAALHTNYPTTTILNDSGAGMEVTYKAKPTSMYRMRRR